MKTCFWIFGLLVLAMNVQAQTADLSKRVSLNYSNVKLKKVLRNISETYNIKFSYSNNYIRTNKRVSINIENEPLSIALEDLFGETKIVYASIGNQVVLRVDENKKIVKEEIKKTPQSQPVMVKTVSQKRPTYVGQSRRKAPRAVVLLEMSDIEELDFPELYEREEDFENYRLPLPIKEVKSQSFRDLSDLDAQVSIVPKVSTNFWDSEEKTNNVSLNVLWGRNGGVNGLEVGGLVNTVVGDVKGVQIAGLMNKVGGDVAGSKLITEKEGYNFGVQISGVANVVNNAKAVQCSGVTNFVHEDFEGVQITMGINKVVGNSKGVQIGGLGNIANSEGENVQGALGFNYCKGALISQVAIGANIAEDVKGGQFSLLFNKAKHVTGTQIGLINICDSISGVPIGLFNIVKNGNNAYNRIEIAGSNVLHTNVGLKFGTKQFYNIIQFGARFYADETIRFNTHEQLEVEEVKGKYAWGLGYGIGTTKSLGQKFLINGEVVAMHINELELWTSELNMLGQVKFTLDFKLNKKLSLFVGPSYNIMVSCLRDDVNQFRGSQIINNAFFEDNDFENNIKMSIGFNAGFRF